MGYTDGIDRDSGRSVTSDADQGVNTDARDAAALPQFLRDGTNAPPDVVDASEQGLPKFLQNPSLTVNTPAMVQYMGPHRVSPPSAEHRRNNKKSLQRDKDVIRTTRSSKK